MYLTAVFSSICYDNETKNFEEIIYDGDLKILLSEEEAYAFASKELYSILEYHCDDDNTIHAFFQSSSSCKEKFHYFQQVEKDLELRCDGTYTSVFVFEKDI
jgi:hypothetical protein